MAHDVRGRSRSRAGGLILLAAGATIPPASAAEFSALWIGDFAAVLDGGLHEGATQVGLLEVGVDAQWRLSAGELLLHATAQHTYGGGFSAEWVGDLQTVSNIDAPTATRVLEAWLDYGIAPGWSLCAGKYDLNSEFDAIDAAALFLNSSQGMGPEITQSGKSGPSTFPDTALGLRVRYETAGGDGALRVALLDVDAEPAADGNDVPFTGGPMLALEAEREVAGLQWKAGAWSYTRSRPLLRDPTQDGREYGGYVSVEREFGESVSAYARFGLGNAAVARIGRYAGIGIVHESGLLAAREDAVGFGVACARNGRAWRDAAAEAGEATTQGECDLELTWRLELGDHVALQPDLQYVIDPGTDPAVDDALVFVLRVEAWF